MAISVEQAVAQAIPALNAASAATLVWWTEAELYGHGNQALQDLGKSAQAFVSFFYDSGAYYFETTPYESQYALPPRVLDVLLITCGLAGEGRTLHRRTVEEMQAEYGGEWESMTGDPTRYITDIVGSDYLWLWPKPTRQLRVGIIRQSWPAEMAAGQTIPGPAIFQDLAEMAILREARGREGKGAMPDVAQWAGQMVDGLTAICRQYWGRAQ